MMDAGRELDALVAEKVMGFKWAGVVNFEHEGKTHTGVAMTESATFILPLYSTDIAAAWEVVDKIKSVDRTIFHLDFYDGKWTCGFEKINTDMIDPKAEAHTAPFAICLAALKAVGVEID